MTDVQNYRCGSSDSLVIHHSRKSLGECLCNWPSFRAFDSATNAHYWAVLFPLLRYFVNEPCVFFHPGNSPLQEDQRRLARQLSQGRKSSISRNQDNGMTFPVAIQARISVVSKGFGPTSLFLDVDVRGLTHHQQTGRDSYLHFAMHCRTTLPPP